MKHLISILGLLLITVACISCGESPKVFQGVVLQYEASSKTIVARDEIPPNNDLTFSLRNAEIGSEPAAGDSVRISYREKDGELIAIRIMNLSHQSELKKK
jgi:hypothetical protein